MSQQTENSLSKGCFVFKSKRTGSDKTPRSKRNASGDTLQPPACEALWQSLVGRVKTRTDELDSRILQSLLNFFNQNRSEQDCIPTGVVKLGVSISDQQSLFDYLQEVFQKDHFVVRIEGSKESNLKSFLTNLIEQVAGQVGIKSNSVQTLCELADEFNGIAVKKPLLVLVQQVESIEKKSVQDLIASLYCYIESFNVGLILGIVSTSNLHELFDADVLSLLNPHVVCAPPPIEYLNSVIDVFLPFENNPFQLGSQVMSLLWENFLLHDFSLSNFFFRYKFCLFRHYFQFIPLFKGGKFENFLEIFSKLDKNQLEIVRSLPSVRKYIESVSASEQLELLTNDSKFKSKVKIWFEDFQCHMIRFQAVVKCLHSLLQLLPEQASGKQLLTIYVLCLKNYYPQTKEHDELMLYSKVMAQETMIMSLNRFLSHLPASMDEERTEILHLIDELSVSTQEKAPASAVGNEESSSVSSPARNAFQLQERLRSRSKPSSNILHEMRSKFVSFLSSFFRESFKQPQEFPLQDVFYFDDVRAVRDHLFPEYRAAIHRALTHPPDALKEKGRDPEVSIVYRIYLECGRNINMHDWFQSFLAQISLKSLPKEQQKQWKARFVAAVHELQFLGFLKFQPRKPGFVTKIVWHYT